MGAQLDNSRNKKPISEINVTPFVDVVLVLLVIFMITAPMLFNRIELKLPKTKKVSMINFKKKQVILSVSLAGEYYIGEEKYLEEELTDRINYLFQRLNTHTLFFESRLFTALWGNSSINCQFKARGNIRYCACNRN